MTVIAREARQALLAQLVEAAVLAGAEIMKIFEAGFTVETKADASPVTAADRAAEAVILEALRSLAPEVPIIAEEEAAAGRLPSVQRSFFLVDPLDGTKEFVRRGTDFTVNIGLIEELQPTLGVVFAPARGELYTGDVRLGEAMFGRDGATPAPIRVRPPRRPPIALASKSHDVPATETFLKSIGAGERISIGSSLKFCLLARGDADIYPRPSPTMEWDTAAGHAILLSAGGWAQDLDGRPLAYGKPDFFNPGFLASGGLMTPALRSFLAA